MEIDCNLKTLKHFFQYLPLEKSLKSNYNNLLSHCEFSVTLVCHNFS